MNEKSMPPKPKLEPLKVSWMVSPSAPFLRLVAQEGLPVHAVEVQFVAYDKRLDNDAGNQMGMVRIAESPSDFRPYDGPASKPYRQIRICFVGEAYAKVSPAFSDSQVIEEAYFDWSGVPGRWEPGEDIFEYLRRRDRLWYQTGICPNPRIYKVEGSKWLQDAISSERPGSRLNHYIILGHDMFVEILASEHRIIEGQMLDD